MAKPGLIGLTGGIASGKSTVSQMLASFGFPVVDADKIAHQLEAPQSQGLAEIAARFGKDVIQANGKLNRRRLGQIVFNDLSQLNALNAIMQPLIREEIDRQVNAWHQKGHQLVVLDAPLLFEQNYQERCDWVIVVNVRPEIELQRLMSRDGLSAAAARQRVESQVPLAKKVARADVVMDNNGDRWSLDQQVLNLLGTLLLLEHQ